MAYGNVAVVWSHVSRNGGKGQGTYSTTGACCFHPYASLGLLLPLFEKTTQNKNPSNLRECGFQICPNSGMSWKSVKETSHWAPRVSCVAFDSLISSHNRQYVVTSGAGLITGALRQALVGLLSDYKIARQAQAELDKLIYSKWLSKKDVQGLVALQAITAESIRLSLLTSPIEIMYQLNEDIWYNRWFLPKNSIIIFDRENIFSESPKLLDSQVLLSILVF